MGQEIPTKKIILIQPSEAFGCMKEIPVSIIGIASILQKGGFCVEILDARLNDLSVIETVNYIKFLKPDAVGITGLVCSYRYIKDLCFELKRTIPELPIVAGGAFIQTQPNVILPNVPIDVAVIGEGEDVVVELFSRIIDRKSLDGLNNIAFLDADRNIIKTEIKLVENLDRFPLPAYDLLDMDSYLKATHVSHWNNFYFPITTGRGCVHHCYYCGRPSNKIRRPSPEKLLEHMDFLHEEYGVNAFLFSEDSGFYPQDWMIEFCKHKIEKKRDYLFTLAGCPEQVTDELVMFLSKAGCSQIDVAVEHWNPLIQKGFYRTKQSKYIINAWDIFRKNKLPNNGFNILWGHPNDTCKSFMETYKKSIKLVKKYDIPHFWGATLAVYPNSDLYKDALRMEKIVDYEDFLYSLGGYGPYVNLTNEGDEKFVSMIIRIQLSSQIKLYFQILSLLLFKEIFINMTKWKKFKTSVRLTLETGMNILSSMKKYLFSPVSSDSIKDILYNKNLNSYRKIGCFDKMLSLPENANVAVCGEAFAADRNMIRLYNSARLSRFNFLGVAGNSVKSDPDGHKCYTISEMEKCNPDFVVIKKSDEKFITTNGYFPNSIIVKVDDSELVNFGWVKPSLTTQYYNSKYYKIIREGNSFLRIRKDHI